MSIEEKVEVIGDSLHDIRGAIEGAGITGLGDITTYADAISLLGEGQRGIGEIITSTIPLTDAGVHLLDGSLINGSGSYSAFVDYIAGLVTDYPNLFCTEADWQTSVTNYGVCGKFVYDNVNNTVRLPKITGIVEGTTDVSALGDLVEAGLPNIKGEVGWYAGSYITEGAFKKGTGTTYTGNSPGGNQPREVLFDASLSNPIYGNSTTVQPQTIKVLYYIVIATTTKTNIQVNIDEIATDLNGKADVDLTNATDQAKILMGGMAMPSNKYINLTIGASSSTYTAPADGYFCAASSSAWVLLEYNKDFSFANMSASISGISGGRATLPVKKGDVVKLTYSAIERFRFYYAQGSESEAQ